MGGFQFGNQFGLEFAGFLGVQITDFFGDIDKGGKGLIVALFGTLFGDATGPANFDGKLFASGISNEFA